MIADEVRQAVSERMGIPPHELTLDARLADDLGLDGDDAVAFFELLHERFGTDFSALPWREHFNPEGFSLWHTVHILVVAVASGAIAWAIDLEGTAAFAALYVGLVVASYAVLIWLDRRRPRPPPLTFGEVLAAVEAGAWPQPAEEGATA